MAVIASLVSGSVAVKYFGLFSLVIIEGFFVIILSGSLAAQGQMNLVAIILVVTAADFTSDVLFYALGAKLASFRIGRFLGISPKRIESAQRLFKSHGGKLLVLAKLSSYLAPATIAAAGIARMRFSRFLFFCLVGGVPKNTFLIAIGYFLGTGVTETSRLVEDISIALSLILVLILLSLAVRKRLV